MRRLPSFVVALGVLLAARGAHAESRASIHRSTLDNGMRVVVEPVQRSGRAFVMVRYDAGARDDPRGYLGMAHLTEHLSFRGAEVQTAWDDLGATDYNGVTTPDEVFYFVQLPPAAVERAIWIEAERMAFLLEGTGERQLAHEQRIVAHEHKMRTHQAAKISGSVARLLFPEGHPYHFFGGEKDEASAIQLEHVRWYAQAAYRPDRATLVVIGDVAPESVQAWAARYFGPVRSPAPALERARAASAAPLTQTCSLRSGQRTIDDWSGLFWSAPPRDHEDTPVLELVAALLTGPRKARLSQALTRAKGPASEVDASLASYELGGTLEVQLRARRDEELSPMITLVEREVGALGRAPVAQDELEAARAYLLRRYDGALRDPLARALSLAHARDDQALARPRRIVEAAKAEDVQRVVARWLDPRRRVLARTDCAACVREKVSCEEVSP